jgi:DNA repair protein RadA/Sms
LEVEKMGFEEVYAAKHNLKGINLNKFNLKIHAFNKLEEVVAHLFG